MILVGPRPDEDDHQDCGCRRRVTDQASAPPGGAFRIGVEQQRVWVTKCFVRLLHRDLVLGVHVARAVLPIDV
jgi:hypothetical protein